MAKAPEAPTTAAPKARKPAPAAPVKAPPPAAKKAVVEVKNPVKRASVVKPIVHAPAVHTEPKTDKVKAPTGLIVLPKDMDNARYRDLQAEIDAVERSVGVDTMDLIQAGYIQNAISSGVLMYDFVVGGGVAPGRFSILPGLEGSGKSTIVDNLAAVCTLQGIPTYWFDAEAALDPNYAGRIFEKYGLHLSQLMGTRDPRTQKWLVPPVIRYTQDAIGQHIFKTIAGICRSLPTVRQSREGVWYKLVEEKGKQPKWVEDERGGKPQYLFIVDSWPALLTEAMGEDNNKSPMAAQARMFSDYIKLIKAPISQKNCVMFSVNQIRLNPGVTHGCLHSETLIPLVDGRHFKMKDIVEQQIQGRVWSLNETTGDIEAKDIVGWHNNGVVEQASDWINIKSTAVGTTNGFAGVTVTPDHEVFANNAWTKAKDVKVGDKLTTKTTEILHGTLREFMVGNFIGDCSLYADKRAGTAQFKLVNSEQPDYLQWKLEKLGKFMGFKHYKGGKDRKSDIYASPASLELRNWFNRLEGRRSVAGVEAEITPLSLAIWYMDDGCLVQNGSSFSANLSFKRFRHRPDDVAAVSRVLNRLGIEHKVFRDSTYATFNGAGLASLMDLVAEFIIPSMQYKVTPSHRGRYVDFNLVSEPRIVTTSVTVLAVTRGSARMFRQKTKYDISVADNHNYMAGSSVNGFIVHNSPEYEPGGQALKFFSDVRTEIRRVAPGTVGAGKGKFTEEESINGGNDQYVYARIKNTKNKAFSPFREGVMRIRFTHDGEPGDGVCETYDVIQFLLATGQMQRRGDQLKMAMRPVTAKSKNNPFFEDGKVVKYRDFKILVESPENKRAVYKHCLAQLRSGYAFEIEREAVKKIIASQVGKPRDVLGLLDGPSEEDEGGIEA